MEADEELRELGAQMIADGKRLKSKGVRINEVVEILRRYGFKLVVEVETEQEVE